MDRPVIKFGDVKVGDIIKYNFSFPQFESEPVIVNDTLAEVVAVTPKHCTLEYTDFAGETVKIPYESIVKVYCDTSLYCKLDEL